MCSDNIDDCKRCLTSEQLEMEKYRWTISKIRGYDVGKSAYIEWISKYAEIWRMLDDYERDHDECRCQLESEIDNVTIEMNVEEKLHWLKTNLKKWLIERPLRE